MKASKVHLPRRRCIFCGGTSLSKEHIFPRWMRDYLPEYSRGTAHTVARAWEDEKTGKINFIRQPGKLTLKGDHRSRGLRVVCESCNNGWMSVIQSTVKPILEPMLTGPSSRLGIPEQTALARWCALLTTVYEQADPGTVSVSEAHREDLKNGNMPPSWFVWIGAFSGAGSAKVWHRGIGLDGISVERTVAIPCNAQTTVFAAGRCIFQTLSISSNNYFDSRTNVLRQSGAHLGLHRIWPPVAHDARIKLNDFGDEDFRRIIDATTPLFVH